MSHRQLDELYAARHRRDAVAAEIAAAKAEPVVDIRALAELQRRHDAAAAECAELEQTVGCI